MKKLPYVEGTAFAVPLRGDGYGIGVVARMSPRGRILLVYLFGPRRTYVPTASELDGLAPRQAVRRLRIGDLHLVDGKWPIIGLLPGWERNEWPMPDFLRRDELSDRAWRVIYDDVDPGKVVGKEPADRDDSYEGDGLHGAGAVEILLTKCLA
jgi:hypothetical protein